MTPQSEPDLLAAALGAPPEAARQLLRLHPGEALLGLPEDELARQPGLTPARAHRLAAAFELARRWSKGSPGEPVDSPQRALRELQGMAELRKEHFVALYLDAAHRLVHRETVSVGTLTASLVHPREVFAPALERPAAALIVAHNHPSGDPTPSREDRETTRRLCDAGRILGLPVLDHLVVAARGWFSFRERGLLDA